MATFELKIDTDNAAFEDGYVTELERIFARVVEQLNAADYLDGKHSNIRDINGNVVGTFKVTP